MAVFIKYSKNRHWRQQWATNLPKSRVDFNSTKYYISRTLFPGEDSDELEPFNVPSSETKRNLKISLKSNNKLLRQNLMSCDLDSFKHKSEVTKLQSDGWGRRDSIQREVLRWSLRIPVGNGGNIKLKNSSTNSTKFVILATLCCRPMSPSLSRRLT